jgi:hypothetical protein
MQNIHKEFDYGELIQRIRIQTKTDNMELQKCILEIEKWIDAYKDTYKEMLTSDWNNTFGNIPFDEQLLNDEIDKYLAQVKSDSINKFKQKLKQEKKLKIVKDTISLKRNWSSLLVFIITIVGVITSLLLIGQPNDWSMWIGIIILIASIIFFITKFKPTGVQNNAS